MTDKKYEGYPFSFKALDVAGRKKRGTIYAKTSELAALELKNRKLFPTQIWSGTNQTPPTVKTTRILGQEYTDFEITQAILHWEQEGRP